jgi:DNA-binding PucR family transcriptional regulator
MIHGEQDPFEQSFDDLESLVDKISEVLSCPVTIEDANHRLLVYSSHEPGIDPARIATIVGRRVPEKVINSLWREGVIPKLLDSDEPVRVDAIGDIGLGNRVAISIRDKDEVLGYIWVLEVEKHLDEKAQLQIKRAAQVAKAKLLQLQERKQKVELGHQDFLWQLITGHTKTTSMIKEKAEKLHIRLPDYFQVMIFHFIDRIDDALHKQIQYILTTIQRIRIVASLIDQNKLIILASPLQIEKKEEESVDFISTFLKQMKERFEVDSIEVACGTLYQNDYSKVEQSYQEGLHLLLLKKRYPREMRDVYELQHAGFYRYISWINEGKQRESLVNPYIHKLKMYDAENGTDLLHTLEIFISHDSHAKETADVLHIHINTLNYRLKRIEEIAGINLKNMDQKVSVYLDIKADRAGK